ncbi:hypothetical protein DPMN_023359 [Dreissena polymorpha]|uniref:Uncharacterized protein n=1 Tax=Dreissena polymorpha TaxID=45954 RepID=A0A9D4R9U5_DREPO|nr:hypothetical protein DPMN_023359 [Dreissena polymorpha]
MQQPRAHARSMIWRRTPCLKRSGLAMRKGCSMMAPSRDAVTAKMANCWLDTVIIDLVFLVRKNIQ